MKTFEEALTLVFCKTPAAGPFTMPQAAQVVLFEKHDSVVKEATKDQLLAAIIQAVIVEVAEERLAPRDALITLFCNGLVVGIEMEKQEL